MFNFCFFKREEKTPYSILRHLWGDMESYLTEFPAPTCLHYRQTRAKYIAGLLKANLSFDHSRDYEDTTGYEAKRYIDDEKNLKKIVLELYIHYDSIDRVSKSSYIRNSLKKAITDIMKTRNYNFKGVDLPSYNEESFNNYAIAISKEEEKIGHHEKMFAFQGFCTTIKMKGGNDSKIFPLFQSVSKYVGELFSPKKEDNRRLSYDRN